MDEAKLLIESLRARAKGGKRLDSLNPQEHAWLLRAQASMHYDNWRNLKDNINSRDLQWPDSHWQMMITSAAFALAYRGQAENDELLIFTADLIR